MRMVKDFFEILFFRRLNVKLDYGAYLPEHAHGADAGYDFRTPTKFSLPAHGSAVIDTGVHMAIPRHWYGSIQSKSGLTVKRDVITCGTIDSGYTGSIRVKLYNFGQRSWRFEKGDKIAQIVFMRCGTPKLKVVDKLDVTERGDKGFGSTGR